MSEEPKRLTVYWLRSVVDDIPIMRPFFSLEDARKALLERCVEKGEKLNIVKETREVVE